MRLKTAFIITFLLASTLAFADDEDRRRGYLYEQVKQNTNDIDNLDSRVQTNTNSIQQLSDQIQNLPTGGGTGGNNDAQVQANTSAINSLTTTVQGNTTEINNLRSQVQANTTAIGQNSVLAQNATNTVNALTPQVQANTSAVNQLSIDVNNLLTSLTGLSGEVAALTTGVDTLSTEVTSLGSQVQTNSSAIANLTTRVAALESTGTGGGGGTTPSPETFIDFTLYINPVGQKVFRSSSLEPCQYLYLTVSNPDPLNTSSVTHNERLTSLQNGTGPDCSSHNYGFTQSANALSLVSYGDALAGTTVNFTDQGDVLTSTMQNGRSHGFALTSATNPAQSIIRKYTILGIEAVTVPFGSYQNCLKIHVDMMSTISGMPEGEQISWYCENTGEVKRVFMDIAPNPKKIHVYQLESYTP